MKLQDLRVGTVVNLKLNPKATGTIKQINDIGCVMQHNDDMGLSFFYSKSEVEELFKDIIFEIDETVMDWLDSLEVST